MGICLNEAKMIVGLKKHNHNLGKVVTIGRQFLFLSNDEIKETLLSVGVPANVINSYLEEDHTFCETYLKLLGAELVDSMDVSNYENATIIHNMNMPYHRI